MRITLITVGVTSVPYVREGIGDYTRRLGRFCDFQLRELKVRGGGSTPESQREREGELLLRTLGEYASVVLLDEGGDSLTSSGFARLLEGYANGGTSRLAFVVGGPYGFAQEVRDSYTKRLSLSPMTLPHDLVRLFFVEQLYRAFSITKGTPYHHE